MFKNFKARAVLLAATIGGGILGYFRKKTPSKTGITQFDPLMIFIKKTLGEGKIAGVFVGAIAGASLGSLLVLFASWMNSSSNKMSMDREKKYKRLEGSYQSILSMFEHSEKNVKDLLRDNQALTAQLGKVNLESLDLGERYQALKLQYNLCLRKNADTDLDAGFSDMSRVPSAQQPAA